MKNLSDFEEGHREILRQINVDAVVGLRIYLKNKGLYDALPKEVFDSIRDPEKVTCLDYKLAKKLEVIAEVEKVENFLMNGLSVRKGVRLMTEECIDYVIDCFYSGLRILDKTKKWVA